MELFTKKAGRIIFPLVLNSRTRYLMIIDVLKLNFEETINYFYTKMILSKA